ncbi:MAG: ATP-dependent sacrificial sulfur transferase LarE [Spirochaetes bacterium]|nr:ATP-dependent sacrificial sulfur transferase LarE [Spirochaetota bacterium]
MKEFIITLEQFFKENPSVAIGFSGGVDSSYLLYAGLHYGAKVKAYYVKAAFQPEFEFNDALNLARHLGADVKVLEVDVFASETVLSNPADRCYHCKNVVFGEIKKQAAADGFSLLVDGTNASDDAGDRPGMKALQELSVRSPLRECGLGKDEIRRLSKEAGLETWNKPSYACLATRIPFGRRITQELLTKVEQSENALFALGFSDFRVRVLGDDAKLQVPVSQMGDVLNKCAEIVGALKPHFSAVLLDMEGR